MEQIEQLEKSEGTNPSQEIISSGTDGKELEKLQFSAIYKIKGTNNEQGFAIRKGQYGIVELEYFRKLIYQDLYMSCQVPKQDGTGKEVTNPEIREMMTKRTSSQDELKEAMTVYYKIENLDKQGVPKNIDIGADNISLTKLTKEQVKLELVQRITNDPELKYDYDIKEANEIVNLLIDEEYNFQNALEKVDEKKKTGAKETPENKPKEEEQEENYDDQRVPWPPQ